VGAGRLRQTGARGPLIGTSAGISLRQFPNSYWRYLLGTALLGLGNCSNAFLILRTWDSGASLGTTILIHAAFDLVAARISYPAASLSDKWGRENVLIASFVIFLSAYLGFALSLGHSSSREASWRTRALEPWRTDGRLEDPREGFMLFHEAGAAAYFFGESVAESWRPSDSTA